MTSEAYTIEPVCIEEFCRKLAPRVRFAGYTELAPEMPTYRAPFMERFGRLLDSDLGARVSTACMTFGFFALVMIAIDAAARAQGF